MSGYKHVVEEYMPLVDSEEESDYDSAELPRGEDSEGVTDSDDGSESEGELVGGNEDYGGEMPGKEQRAKLDPIEGVSLVKTIKRNLIRKVEPLDTQRSKEDEDEARKLRGPLNDITKISTEDGTLRFSCARCPNVTLKSESAVAQHLQGKAHKRNFRNEKRASWTPEMIQARREKNKRKREKRLEKKKIGSQTEEGNGKDGSEKAQEGSEPRSKRTKKRRSQ